MYKKQIKEVLSLNAGFCLFLFINRSYMYRPYKKEVDMSGQIHVFVGSPALVRNEATRILDKLVPDRDP